MKLPKLPPIPRDKLFAGFVGAGIATLLFAGFATFVLAMLPFLFMGMVIAGLIYWFTRPTEGENDV